ncbi:hypothetical protein ACFYU5_26605 [Nocardia aobensis]|uniref:Uncharacterized protein n=1 Tax=Nocardia aobensis TaxID=257277 RepID=A0ABW6PA17_9NOCA
MRCRTGWFTGGQDFERVVFGYLRPNGAATNVGGAGGVALRAY